MRICFSGDGESRTRVQRKHQRAFYMLSFLLNCRDYTRTGNPPMYNPYPLRFRVIVEAVHDTKLEGLVDVRHAVYRASSARHNGILRSYLRQPWQSYDCHLKKVRWPFVNGVSYPAPTCLLTNNLSCRCLYVPRNLIFSFEYRHYT